MGRWQWASLSLALAIMKAAVCDGRIPTTLEGPFEPVTAALGDGVFRGNAVDLPDDDPRVRRKAEGFEPEQISVSLSATPDSVWISWISGLKSGTQYFYRCGGPSIAMSDIHVFRTMPVSGPQSYPMHIAIIGDLGLTYNTTSTIDHMRCNGPDLIVLVGDVTCANMYLPNGTGSNCYSCEFDHNTPIHESYQPRWDYWGRFMEPTLSEIPIMVIEGNHELEKQAEDETFVSYNSRFAFPSEESGSFSTFYYSFNAGGIHFIMIGGYVSYNKSGEQYKWLERETCQM